ncbi:amino acid synthesis family protein [Thermoanaerobacteraceae bacterium SP2]|nr:amino acid synthesis family protein [Thermoanaerobacteraceae bacterium SP2]
MEIRKLCTIVEETYMDLKKRETPTRKAAALAVIKNPYVGRFSENLDELIEAGEELGTLLTRKAKEALGITKEQVHSFGKAVIVGEDGELEHAAAVMHPKLGTPVRDEVDGVAIIPSAKKKGGIGTAIDVPLHYKKAMRVRSHFDAMEVRIPDAPHRDELVVIVAVTDSGRPFPRVGGLKLEDVKGEDGLV